MTELNGPLCQLNPLNARSRINYYANQSTTIKTRETRADVRVYQRSRRHPRKYRGGKMRHNRLLLSRLNSCGVLNSLLSRPNAKAHGIGTLKILNPFGLLKILLYDKRSTLSVAVLCRRRLA